ncbi:MAG: carbohydrate ABC transporter substrate-binding protein, partial [Pseudomonadota bacterium]
MKLRYSVLAVAMACAMASQGWADEAAAKKWIDSEFQPSTLSKAQQAAEMKWFIDAAAKLKTKGVKEIS